MSAQPKTVKHPRKTAETPRTLRDPVEAVLQLQDLIDESLVRMRGSDEERALIMWANSIGMNILRLVNSHRILRWMSAATDDTEAAIRELEQLGFEED